MKLPKVGLTILITGTILSACGSSDNSDDGDKPSSVRPPLDLVELLGEPEFSSNLKNTRNSEELKEELIALRDMKIQFFGEYFPTICDLGDSWNQSFSLGGKVSADVGIFKVADYDDLELPTNDEIYTNTIWHDSNEFGVFYNQSIGEGYQVEENGRVTSTVDSSILNGKASLGFSKTWRFGANDTHLYVQIEQVAHVRDNQYGSLSNRSVIWQMVEYDKKSDQITWTSKEFLEFKNSGTSHSEEVATIDFKNKTIIYDHNKDNTGPDITQVSTASYSGGNNEVKVDWDTQFTGATAAKAMASTQVPVKGSEVFPVVAREDIPSMKCIKTRETQE